MAMNWNHLFTTRKRPCGCADRKYLLDGALLSYIVMWLASGLHSVDLTQCSVFDENPNDHMTSLGVSVNNTEAAVLVLVRRKGGARSRNPLVRPQFCTVDSVLPQYTVYICERELQVRIVVSISDNLY